ncbi:MAG TPA: dethiobiotin synthase [Acidimicrobiales bacterium]|nr:dethiobiotin synthase [Acidimicrobiales bacterium]
MRPERLVVVLGTDTGVGKTWTAAAVLSLLRDAGVAVAARKPVQSFAPCDVGTDAGALALATGERPEDVCPRHRWYAMAMAPPMAAAFLGVAPPSLDDLLGELRWPQGTEVGLVETVGGPRSPIAEDADSVDLAAALAPDLTVLVAHAGLGAINGVRLSAPVCPRPLVVFLNHFDGGDLHDRNRRWLQADGVEVVVDRVELARRVAADL